jgi:hypothetical protein
MTTQSLRGMDNEGPMHWRGDRTGANDDVQRPARTARFNEDAAFKRFNVAFGGLIGRSELLTDDEMQAFTSFILEVMYPPNPIRNLDNTMTADQLAGRNFYFSAQNSDTLFNCNGCHVLNPTGNSQFASVQRPGFFGTEGRYTFENETQFFKCRTCGTCIKRSVCSACRRARSSTRATMRTPAIRCAASAFSTTEAPTRCSASTTRWCSTTAAATRAASRAIRSAARWNRSCTPSRATTLRSSASRSRVTAPMVRRSIRASTYFSIASTIRTTRLDSPNNVNSSECDVVAKGVIGGDQRGYVYAGGGELGERSDVGRHHRRCSVARAHDHSRAGDHVHRDAGGRGIPHRLSIVTATRSATGDEADGAAIL